MRKVFLLAGSCVTLAMLLTVTLTTRQFAAPQGAQQEWGPNDRSRPEPPIITPGTATTQKQPGAPPSDAIVLFNGKDLSNWESVKDGGPAKWTVGKGYFATVPGSGYIRTKQASAIASCTWNTPRPILRMAPTRTAAIVESSCRGSTKFRFSIPTIM